eukprot:1120362-Rhodomonas_salina.1
MVVSVVLKHEVTVRWMENESRPRIVLMSGLDRLWFLGAVGWMSAPTRHGKASAKDEGDDRTSSPRRQRQSRPRYLEPGSSISLVRTGQGIGEYRTGHRRVVGHRGGGAYEVDGEDVDRGVVLDLKDVVVEEKPNGQRNHDLEHRELSDKERLGMEPDVAADHDDGQDLTSAHSASVPDIS